MSSYNAKMALTKQHLYSKGIVCAQYAILVIGAGAKIPGVSDQLGFLLNIDLNVN